MYYTRQCNEKGSRITSPSPRAVHSYGRTRARIDGSACARFASEPVGQRWLRFTGGKRGIQERVKKEKKTWWTGSAVSPRCVNPTGSCPAWTDRCSRRACIRVCTIAKPLNATRVWWHSAVHRCRSQVHGDEKQEKKAMRRAQVHPPSCPTPSHPRIPLAFHPSPSMRG